ncbi:subtilisin-like protease SBT5.3 [Telopea speciosissima]|uniref:subtilisin-like protease SBT5.3 n=1 Tax=Telopea speciosissima TaxID=54955 RepID=UPI001CC45931|nr:subtilisin-like protease SBT5.3 [Telopea speciosissima]XP_043688345.1 subtilisin-like protease SBT5.3 [Telopea speciosissima]
MGGFSRLPLFLLPVLLFSMLQRPTFAVKKSYVVYLGSHSHGHGREITQVDMDLAEQSHYEFLADYVGSTQAAKESIIYCYTRHINGFAATLEEEKAAEIAKHPRVISVFPNRAHQLHTTRSWDLLGLEKNGAVQPGSLWEKARFGEDTIIGNLDTGVWPESKSFSDEGYGPIPSRWKGGCTDTTPDGVRCNRKLIGAKAFSKGYAEVVGQENAYNTTRDNDGHGTHTLSTAGGNFVQDANVLGFGNGTSKGGSPRALVAAYKVCGTPILGTSACIDADIIAAFDAAIHDGVDVLSCSLGSPPNDYFHDGMAIGSFHAVKNGIIVVASAGNDGPTPGTVSNTAPWLFTVGASTIDRTFLAYVKLGNNKQLKGQSLSQTSLAFNSKMYPLVTGEAARTKIALPETALYCNASSLDPMLVKGKIVVCLRGGGSGRVEKGSNVLSAGAVGMILVNDIKLGNDVIADAHMLPASHLSFIEGLALYKYINSTKSPTAYISPVTTELGTKPAPSMAAFSSQGPNVVTPEILKPDITGPGVSVIASWSQASPPSGMPDDTRQVSFSSESGTSMSCPHLAGVSGLLKTLYPNWSPYAIRSAIMTTARTRDNVREPMLNSSNMKATPFSYGAGHVRPNRAMDPGLVYDLTTIDHVNFLCAIGYNEDQISLFTEMMVPYKCPKPAISLLDLNYPSIAIPNLIGSATLMRTLKNVGSPATYKAKITPPSGISVSVEPEILTFDSVGQEKTFKLTIKTKRLGYAKDYVFGVLKWFDGRHQVKSQIAVKAAVTV